MTDEVISFIRTHLHPSHVSCYKRGSKYWTDTKWIRVIAYKFGIPKGEYRSYKGLISKEVGKVKSEQ